MFVGCQEQADVKQVSREGMQVCLDTPERLSLCVSFGAISPPLVERLEAVSLASDRSVKDIVFTARILLTPPRRSDSAVAIVFQMNVLICTYSSGSVNLCGHIRLR